MEEQTRYTTDFQENISCAKFGQKCGIGLSAVTMGIDVGLKIYSFVDMMLS